MKRMVFVALCAVMFGWAGAAKADTIMDLVFADGPQLDAGETASETINLASYGVISPDSVDVIWLTLSFSDVETFIEHPTYVESAWLQDSGGVTVTVNGVDVYNGSFIFSDTVHGLFDTFDITSYLADDLLLEIAVSVSDGSMVLSGMWEANAVPEPATLLLFGAGLTGLAAIGRPKKARLIKAAQPETMSGAC